MTKAEITFTDTLLRKSLRNGRNRHFSIIHFTVWKFQDISVIQILRETNFEESRSCKSGNFAILGALNFVNLVNFSLQKVQKFIKSQNSEPLNVLEWQILHF